MAEAASAPLPARPSRRQLGTAALALGALGVVFGDIGTSPLYALQTVFSADHQAVKATEADVYGVISLVFWSITLIVSVEFVLFIMRADNDGEGGILALIALVMGAPLRRRGLKAALIALGMFGVALFYGDGMITPAISVMSAVEGVKVAVPSLESLVLPITIAILAGLFAIQRFGTAVIGRVFGPVMVLWFAVIAAAGLGRVLAHPAIAKALSPHYGVEFFGNHFGIAFIALGAIVLTITGAEALYADMGHFGRKPISRAWFLVVFPALTLNYMGQGSLILETPSAIENPFFLLLPHWGRVPMVLLATVATVIASQAVISGAFSVTKQAVQLGFLPRLNIRHTSAREIGQVYVPAVNWFLLRRGRRPRPRLRLLDQARLRLRDRRHRHDHRRHPALPRRRPRAVAQAGLAGGARRRRLLHRRPRLPRRQPDQGRPRRLVPALRRPRRLHRAQHLEAGAGEGPRGAGRGGGIAALLRRRAARDAAAGGPGARHRRLSQRPPRDDAAGAARRSRAHRRPARRPW